MSNKKTKTVSTTLQLTIDTEAEIFVDGSWMFAFCGGCTESTNFIYNQLNPIPEFECRCVRLRKERDKKINDLLNGCK